MIVWVFLAVAILSEVSATLSLRMAVAGPRRWYAVVGTGYVAAFVLLSFALARGLGIGVAYGIWAAAGVVLTSLASRVFFGEPLTRLMGFGIALIVVGVLLVELGH